MKLFWTSSIFWSTELDVLVYKTVAVSQRGTVVILLHTAMAERDMTFPSASQTLPRPKRAAGEVSRSRMYQQRVNPWGNKLLGGFCNRV